MRRIDQNPRSFPIDVSLPKWACQNCHQNIPGVGFDSYADKFFYDFTRSGMQGSSIHGSGSFLGASSMGQSFVVLAKLRNQARGGVPTQYRNGTMYLPDSNHSHKTMEESFAVLPPPAASVYKTEFGADGSVPHSASSGGGIGGGLTSNSSRCSSNLRSMNRAFDVATSQTHVELPLCLECLNGQIKPNEVEDVKTDIEAYESCLKQLEREERDILNESDFLKEKLKASVWNTNAEFHSQIGEEERKLLLEIEETEKQYAKENSSLKELKVKSSLFKELEEYWHELNHFQIQLTSHQDERDAVLAKIEVSQVHLELLKKTNVLKDAFPIALDGEFGTINNFRLGWLSKVPMEWDEINAAWGQACLLLHTMCQYFQPRFPYRIKILPMGSFPQIMDGSNNTYELFGPVNLFWSARYDKAMTLFLTCQKDFAEFANMQDRENNLPAEKCFNLPYQIENDKVGNYSITQNKQENWTKSLKYTLCNLKWALFWFVSNTFFQPLSVMAPSQAEVSDPGSSSYMKSEGNSKSQYNRKPIK